MEIPNSKSYINSQLKANNLIDQNLNKYSALLNNILNLKESQIKIECENNSTNRLPASSGKVKPTKTVISQNRKSPNQSRKPDEKNKTQRNRSNSKGRNKIEVKSTKNSLGTASSLTSPSLQPKNASVKPILKHKSKSAENLSENRSISPWHKSSKLDLNNDNIIDLLKSKFEKNNIDFKALETLLARTNLNKESKKLFISNLIELLSLTQTQKTSSADEQLIKKLDSMKDEIDKLKNQLSGENVIQRKCETEVKAETNIGEGYAEKLIKMQKKIMDLSELNKSLLMENKNLLNNRNTNTSSQDLVALNEKLKVDLNASNKKCQILECILDQKNKQVEQYIVLFKEITNNVNTLIKELELKELKTNHHLIRVPNAQLERSQSSVMSNFEFPLLDSITESKSINDLRKCLAKFENKLKSSNFIDFNDLNHNSNFISQINPQIQNSYQKINTLSIPKIESNNNVTNNTNFNLDMIKFNLNSNVSTATSSSDTLIDADSSFHSFNIDTFRNGINATNYHHFNNFDNPVILKGKTKTNSSSQLKDQQMKHDQNDYDEEEEDNDKILICMDDLSITTIQTTNESIVNSNLSLVPVKFDENNFVNNINLNDDEFQLDLNKLDEKIFKVKQLLDSMKS